MSAPIDFVEATLISGAAALAIAIPFVAIFATRFNRAVDRLDVLEKRAAVEDSAAAAERSGAVLGSVEEALWTIDRVREVFGHEIAGDRFLNIVRQILAVLPHYKPGSDENARKAGERQAYLWCADYLDEVRGERNKAPVDRMLDGIARTFRREAGKRQVRQDYQNPVMTAQVERPSRLAAASREALSAYRAIFATGSWNDRDRWAFAELEAALDEVRR